MATYEYKNGLTGQKLKGYNNDENIYDIEFRDGGFSIFAKNGEIVLEVDDERKCDIFIHTHKNKLAVQKTNKQSKTTRVVALEGTDIVSDCKIKGEVEKVIFGSERMYFQKFEKYSGNRFYSKIVNENDVSITPPYQVIIHEVNEDDKGDRFYCENYAEISKDEFLEEDEADYRANLVKSAVYSGTGKEIFTQNHNGSYGSSSYGSSMTEAEKNYHKQMIAGSLISIPHPLLGSAIMVSAMIDKKRKDDGQKQQKIEVEFEEDPFEME